MSDKTIWTGSWGVVHSCRVGDETDFEDRHYPVLHWEDDERTRLICDHCGQVSPTFDKVPANRPVPV